MGLPCVILHRLWWVPVWNRSAFLACPLVVLTSHRHPRIAAWYWKGIS